MTIVGQRPEGGVRIELERAAEGAAPWNYRGHAVTPLARFPLHVVLSQRGDVQVDLPPDAPNALATRVRLMMRALWRHARDEGAPPARRLMRWRPDD